MTHTLRVGVVTCLIGFRLIPRSLLFSLIAPLQCGPGNEVPFQLSLFDFFSYFNALLGLPLPLWQGTLQSRRLGPSRFGWTRRIFGKIGRSLLCFVLPGSESGAQTLIGFICQMLLETPLIMAPFGNYGF